MSSMVQVHMLAFSGTFKWDGESSGDWLQVVRDAYIEAIEIAQKMWNVPVTDKDIADLRLLPYSGNPYSDGKTRSTMSFIINRPEARRLYT